MILVITTIDYKSKFENPTIRLFICVVVANVFFFILLRQCLLTTVKFRFFSLGSCMGSGKLTQWEKCLLSQCKDINLSTQECVKLATIARISHLCITMVVRRWRPKNFQKLLA